MKRNRSLLVLAASVGIVACGDQASKLLGPDSTPETGSFSSQNSGGGYTWTIKKELVAVHLMTTTGEMPVDPVSPYSIKVGEIKWFDFKITYTRTNGGHMGSTAVISDDVAGACAMLGAGFECTSVDSDFGIPFTGGQVGIKTWTVSGSGQIEGMLDIKNKNAGCPSARMMTNTAVLSSNGKVRSSVDVPLKSPNCGESEKRHCNQGVGNGPEGCDPGNSNHNQPSNDENGGTPGNPGRKGGH